MNDYQKKIFMKRWIQIINEAFEKRRRLVFLKARGGGLIPMQVKKGGER